MAKAITTCIVQGADGPRSSLCLGLYIDDNSGSHHSCLIAPRNLCRWLLPFGDRQIAVEVIK
jgi:hypothetical protein